MGMLKLSRTFTGHKQDVRGVAASDSHIYSCSRDGTVRTWPLDKNAATESAHHLHNGFVNSIAVDGNLVISGGQDSIIYVVTEGQTEPIYTLVGHTDNVCALATGPDGLIISGSWDGTVKLWQDGICINTLDGHQGAVWAVLHTPHGILTGGADKTIRLWKDGRQIRNFPAGKDCIRALALHPLGFVSGGNDATIRIHTFDGTVVQQLEGHESFIYSLSVEADGTIYSAGEDGTLRVWINGKQHQSIKHPAVSIWCVTCLNNGDVATGTSEGIVRIFTAASDRFAPVQEVKAFEEVVAASQIPAQSSNIPNNLPGLEALSASGKKEGEVKMIRLNGGTVEAHQWSGGVWTKIGEVVGATPKRVEHEGQEYDFVFDVDIAEGAPPLKLPYNTDENPYEAAQKFIDKNELDVGFLQQIVKFIETNTGGVPLGVSKEKAPEAQAQAVPLIAQHDYLSMVSGNASPILNKLKSFCSELNIDFQTPANLEPDSFSGKQFEALLDTLKRLPRDKRFPALDLIRLAVPSAKNLSTAMVMDILACAGVMPATSTKDKIQETNSMLANRTLANLYSNAGHRAIVEDMDTQAISAISDNFTPSHRNLCLAQATYLLNVSVFGRKHDRPDLAVAVVEPLLLLLSKSPDEEVRYRSLVALSTAMQCADEVSVTAKEIYDAGRVLDQVRSNAQNWPRHLQVLDGLDRLLRDARLQ